MAQRSSTSNSEEQVRRRLVSWGIVLALVVACEVVAFVAFEPRAPIDEGERFYAAGTRPTLSSSLVQWQTVRARGLSNTADVIFIGDSSCTMGVIPEVLESRTALDVENFCLVQWLSIDGQIDIFEEYLKTHNAPRALVYYFSDAVLGMSHAKFSQLAMRDSYRSWLGRDTRNVAFAWPSTRLRTRARGLIGGHFYQETHNDMGVRDFMVRHQGFVRESRVDAAEIAVPVLPLHVDSADGLQRLFSLAARHEMTVYLMHAPVPQLADSLSVREDLGENEALMRALASDYPGVKIALSFLHFAPTTYFRDYEHLAIEGAQQNSYFIAEWMRQALD